MFEVRDHITVIVLAAGGSTRYGQSKQLLPWGDTTLVGQSTRVALAAGAHQVIVVVGHQAKRVAAAVHDAAGGRPLNIVVNRHWATGQSTSVRAGLAALATGTDAAIFLLADQPDVSPSVLTALIQRHRRTMAPIIVPTYRGQRGNPILFDKTRFEELAVLKGDVGGRSLIAHYAGRLEYVVVTTPGILRDIDTPEDYRCSWGDVGFFWKNKVEFGRKSLKCSTL